MYKNNFVTNIALRRGGLDTWRLLRHYSTTEYEETRFHMAWMYILKCADGSYYVDSTRNLDLRLSQHQWGKGSRYTSGRLPVELVYAEEYNRIIDAYVREKQRQRKGFTESLHWSSRVGCLFQSVSRPKITYKQNITCNAVISIRPSKSTRGYSITECGDNYA